APPRSPPPADPDVDAPRLLEATATNVTAPTTTTTPMAAASTGHRRRGRASDRASVVTDEGVDGNGGEQRREVEVREAEVPDRERGVRVAHEPPRATHEERAEQGRDHHVQRPDRRHEPEREAD